MSYGRDRKYSFLLIAAGLVCFLVAAVLLHTFKGRFVDEAPRQSTLPVMEDTIDVSSSAMPDAGQTNAPTQDKAAVWIIYVTGAVKNPGVYEVPSGARVYQALDAAGGFSDSADREAVNLAATMQDGAHVRIPVKGEKKMDEHTPPPNSSYLSPSPRADFSAPAAIQRKIDLNRCTAKELEEIPGVGPKTALVIVQYREKEGGFRRVEDLLLISGIGPKKFDVIKEYVIVAN